MSGNLYIAKSKTRQDLLALFFTNPSNKYYLRELERLLGYAASTIRRELLKFQEDGLLKTERTGNLVYYYLNASHPLFKELKNIVFKTVGVEGSLKQMVSSVKGIKTAFIYGSFARNKERAVSDIDLMLIGNPDMSGLNEKIAALERRLKREINPTVYSAGEYKEKKKSGAGFLTDVLKNPIIMLMGERNDL